MRRLCIFAVGFSAATVLCVLLRATAVVFGMGAVLAAIGLGLHFLKGRTARRVSICLLGLAAGLSWYALYSAAVVAPARALDGTTQQITATASGFSVKTRYGASVDAKIALGGRSVDAVLYLPDSAPDLRPGDRVTLEAALSMANDDRSQASVYLRSRGTVLIAKSRSEIALTRAERPPVRTYPAYAAHALRASIDAVFPEDTAGFLAALLTGQRDGLNYARKMTLSDAGIYHTVAVSGLHVTILLGMIVLLCGARRRLAAAIGLPMLAFFVLMTGAPASAVRAGFMAALLCIAPLVGRENDFPTSLSAALMLLLAANPWAAYDVGLQLSFASVSGIALFAARIYQHLAARPLIGRILKRGGIASGAARVMLSAFCSSLGALSLSTPLCAYHFGVLSLAAPVTNALCLWAVTAVFAAGLATSLVGLVAAPVSAGLAWLLSWLVRYIYGVSDLMCRIPHAALYLENGYQWALAAVCYAALLALLIRPKLVTTVRSAASLAACVIAILTLSYFDYHTPEFTFTALDVGQGQCLIYSSGRDTCIIDCGGAPDESGELAARYLRANGVSRASALVLTHFDADHVNGVCQLLRRIPVDVLYVPEPALDEAEDENTLRREILDEATRAGVQVKPVREDMACPIGSGNLQIFAPVSGETSNDSGLCVLASCAEYDILVTGDLTQRAEWRLLSAHDFPDLELLVAGHHGAKTSTSRTLLDLTAPDCVIVSVGAGNSFGHPAPQTLSRIESSGAIVYRTDENGTITIRR